MGLVVRKTGLKEKRSAKRGRFLKNPPQLLQVVGQPKVGG